MSDHGFRLRPHPKGGMNGLVTPLPVFLTFQTSPPPPLVPGTPLCLDPYKSVFYIPKDVFITTAFAILPYPSATDSSLFLNIPLFLLPFGLFLLWLWQISPSFYSHKHRACLHSITSVGVSRTFSLKFSIFCVSPLWTSTTFICCNVKMLLCAAGEQIFFPELNRNVENNKEFYESTLRLDRNMKTLGDYFTYILDDFKHSVLDSWNVLQHLSLVPIR